MDNEDPISHFFPGEDDVDLYAVLSLTKSATIEDIKKAYRRLALTLHPDKHVNSTESAKKKASTRFQQVGFTYSVLSDENRREHYDRTGRTDEGFLGSAVGEDGWEAYFEVLFDQVTREKLDEMKVAYQGSNEEVEDLKAAYITSEGSISAIMARIPHSTHTDEARFVSILSALISSDDLPSFSKWEKGLKDENARKLRQKEGEKEAKEAEAIAKDLGVWDEFFGDGQVGERRAKGKAKQKTKGKGKEDEEVNEDALRAVIQRKASGRSADDFLDNLAAKYGGEVVGEVPKRGRKRTSEGDSGPRKKTKSVPEESLPEIDEEEFKALQRKLFKGKGGGEKETIAPSPEKSKGKGKSRRSK